MKLEALTVALRPRTSWEACELGMALVRRHAGAIWKPWLLVTLPLLVLLNAAGWALDLLWLSGLLMWWLKPWFDRIPLFVISRAVFGETPSTRQTVRAQLRWGARWWLPYLTWRRLGPARSLYLPVDLLEGGDSSEARQRRSALGAPVYGVCALLTLVCANFEMLIVLGTVFAGLVIIPFDYLPDTLKSLWDSFLEQPHWMNALFNGLIWIAVSVIEPFYVGAGFGLYLNRRTEIEGWDIEIVFRRLRARLAAAAAPTLLALCLMFGWLPDAAAQIAASDEPAAAAQVADAPSEASDDADSEEDPEASHTRTAPIREFDSSKKSRRLPSTLGELYGDARADDRGLRDAVAKTMLEPSVAPKRKQSVWKAKNEVNKDEPKAPDGALFKGLGQGLASALQVVLWGILAVIVGLLLFSAGRWLGWFRGGGEEDAPAPGEVRTAALAEPEPLPDNLPTAIRRLWRSGRHRDALALMYRAAVESMAARAQIVLVPGATEAQCLRASRKLGAAEDRDVFARAVRTWQYAAYAQTLPGSEDFDDLVGQLAQRFGWTA
ncbi:MULTISPECIES: DUF4129 domain-containing protein [unclassified Lysobacter]|uniref:DUF4129 domain-containing protein n=1 Tax=unclassified Lysobacter TaxID=2635362 RepID=UPI001BE6CA9B|nr:MULTISPECIES: DUF4129 domain-containing protein [unclassified Lysobacter]MBT2749008.1 DUF4129 domain-containing protein [Lysobacter sp. ISL-42]MBT2750341.1 DUF4129 domain-containing protein [Lysobacter sp. ISL-50]MBT2778439.1 DUF4129 domain-containing protein [Lysobacter sp. ISL-54]MBT2781055.1 DUF4129 domain-containing protein [Lysobacter sp. ISL-52]